MITQLPLLIVSLLVAITQATPFEYEIDPDRCNKDIACYVRRSCINLKSSDDTKLVYFDGDKDGLFFGATDLTTPTGTCDLFVHIKAMSEKKYLVVMELKSEAGFADADLTTGISISHNSEMQIKCSKDSAAPTGDAKFKVEHKGEKFQHFETNRMFCALILTPADETVLSIVSLFPDATKKPSFEYAAVKVEYIKPSNDFWKAKNEKCSQMYMTSSNGPFDAYMVKEADTSKSKIVCDDGVPLIVKYEGTEVETDKVTCVSGDWTWNEVSADEAGKPLEIGCMESKFCASCSELTPLTGCPDCTLPTTEVKDGCHIRKCPKDKWKLDGEAISVISTTVTCGKDGSSSAWFIHDTDSPKKITEASCRSVVDCTMNTVTVECPDNVECEATLPTVINGTIKCPGGDLKQGNGVTITPSCSRESGEWVDLVNPVYCEMAKEGNSAKSDPQTGGVGTGMILGIVFGLLVVIGVSVGGYFFYKSRQKKAKGGARGGTTSKKTGKQSSKKSSEKSKSKSGDLKKSDSDPIEKQADEDKAKPAADAAGTPATPAGDKPPPTTDIEGLKTDKDGKTDPPTPSNPKVPPTPSPAAPAGALPV